MPLLLVYRALRKASEWMQAFYSDVLVEGQENVPNDGPLIIVANHHNELVDIATLGELFPAGHMTCIYSALGVSLDSCDYTSPSSPSILGKGFTVRSPSRP